MFRTFVLASALITAPFTSAFAQSECQIFDGAVRGLKSGNPAVIDPSAQILHMAYSDVRNMLRNADRVRESRGCPSIANDSFLPQDQRYRNTLNSIYRVCSGNPEGNFEQVALYMYQTDAAIASTGYGQPQGCN